MAALSVSAFDEQSDVTVRLQDFEVLAARVLQDQGVPEPAELSISFVSEAAIAELNLRYRGIDGPTDVLSFSIDGEAALGGQVAADGEEGPVGDEAPVLLLGDVVVSPAVARANAEARGIPVRSELGLLVVHGVLHVLGYDHEDDAEAAEMEELEHRYLAQWWDPAGRPGSSR
jgi:probable rRNA maturation factor